MSLSNSIILASASPRRAHLLTLLGVAFQTDVSTVDEDLGAPGAAAERASELALAKARAVAGRHAGQTILAADTLISVGGQLLGKPLDGSDAVAMLRSLCGTWHRVFTGVAVIVGASGKELVAVEETRVLMRKYTDEEMATYVASGDAMDKAAAYAVQSSAFHPVERLSGCYTNVMGLPLCTTCELLSRAGVVLPRAIEGARRRDCSLCALARL